MPFPEHYLLQWGGDFVSDPSEIWSNGIRFCTDLAVGETSLPSMTGAQQDAAAAGCLTVLNTHRAIDDSFSNSNCRLKFVKFNRIAADGGYNDETATHAAYAAGSGVPGVTGGALPITSALVVTFLTGASRGPASRGRLFIPHPSVNLGAPTYRIAPTDCTDAAAVYRTLIVNLNGAVTTAGGTGGLKACVVSAVGEGLARAITQTQIGNFVDHMGSRRNNLNETRVSSAVI